jgi:hypothetical protein
VPPPLPSSPPLPRHALGTELSAGVVHVDAWGIGLMRSSESAADEDQAHVLHRRAAAGQLVRIRPGVFVQPGHWNGAYPRERHLAAAWGIALTARHVPVFCRETALLFHDLPLGRTPDTVRLRAFSSGAARRRSWSQPRASSWPVPGEQRISVPRAWAGPPVQPRRDERLNLRDGVALDVEDLRFCLADTLPRLSTGDAVIVADALLSGLRSSHDAGLVRSATPWSRADLAALSGLCVSHRARRRFEWIVDHADGRSESPGESLSRVRMHELGFRRPELQHEVLDARGRSLGVLDFWWPDLRLAGEFDGWGKYTDARSYSGRDRDTVFLEEKRRAERIQEQGIRFVRWMWDDLQHPARFAERLQRAGVPRACHPTPAIRASSDNSQRSSPRNVRRDTNSG